MAHYFATEQAGAVCWRVSSSRIEILLITSKDTGRWIIPKGNIRRREPSFRAAQREALEESGVSGKIRKTTVGYYLYAKNEETSLTVAGAFA
ncbi:NUDIX domain-containing protein [Rhizobium wenxiniae]|uniref:NUDIX hydrolase n=1 Tax=Rhizobium wenxiniae TaxID=1737357 RepID=UPI001CB78577